ncbi:MAG: cupin domain-containing protein [Gaiellaceae bacterium]
MSARVRLQLLHLPAEPGRPGARPHADSDQEEVYFVIRGSGTMRIDGEEIELRPNRFIRVDSAATRLPVSGADGLEYLVFGAPPDGKYAPPAWG